MLIMMWFRDVVAFGVVAFGVVAFGSAGGRRMQGRPHFWISPS
jgi:hypothetical protein